MKNKLNVVILIAVVAVGAYLILDRPQPQIRIDTSKSDSLENVNSLIIANLHSLSVEFNRLQHEKDSLLKIEPNEKIIDSISNVQFLGIDANIELWPILLSDQDSAFRRHLDSCRR